MSYRCVIGILASALLLPAPERSMIVYSADAIVIGELTRRVWKESSDRIGVSGVIPVQRVLYGKVSSGSRLTYQFTCLKEQCGKVESVKLLFNSHVAGIGIWFLKRNSNASWASAGDVFDDGFRPHTEEDLSYTQHAVNRRVEQERLK